MEKQTCITRTIYKTDKHSLNSGFCCKIGEASYWNKVQILFLATTSKSSTDAKERLSTMNVCGTYTFASHPVCTLQT